MKLALKLIATLTVIVVVEVVIEQLAGIYVPTGIASILTAGIWWQEIKAVFA